jgi:hypothetical protein
MRSHCVIVQLQTSWNSLDQNWLEVVIPSSYICKRENSIETDVHEWKLARVRMLGAQFS